MNFQFSSYCGGFAVMSVHTLTSTQKEAVVREWAREQLQDARFNILPADLARLLVVYSAQAGVDMYMATEEHRAMVQLWKLMKPSQCECGKLLFDSDRNGPQELICTKCSTTVCGDCDSGTLCGVCGVVICAGCMVMIACTRCKEHTCGTCAGERTCACEGCDNIGCDCCMVTYPRGDGNVYHMCVEHDGLQQIRRHRANL